MGHLGWTVLVMWWLSRLRKWAGVDMYIYNLFIYIFKKINFRKIYNQVKYMYC